MLQSPQSTPSFSILKTNQKWTSPLGNPQRSGQSRSWLLAEPPTPLMAATSWISASTTPAQVGEREQKIMHHYRHHHRLLVSHHASNYRHRSDWVHTCGAQQLPLLQRGDRSVQACCAERRRPAVRYLHMPNVPLDSLEHVPNTTCPQNAHH